VGVHVSVSDVQKAVPHIFHHLRQMHLRVGYTLVTLPRIVPPYRDSVDGTRDRVTYQKLVTL
jgi:hypothetical protein